MERIQTVKFRNPDYGDIYTAHIHKNGSGWRGWIQEYPKVKCEEQTKETLLKTLEITLYETLEADWEAWDKQLECAWTKTRKLFKLTLSNSRYIYFFNLL